MREQIAGARRFSVGSSTDLHFDEFQAIYVGMISQGRKFVESVTQKRSSNFVFLGYAAVVGAAILSGLIPSASKPALHSMSPILFTAIVTLAPAIMFTPLSMRPSRENKHIKKWGFVILALTAVAGAFVAPYIYFVGLQTSQASDATLLGNGEMVFTVLLASLFFGERLRTKGMFAMTLLGAGIIIAITDLRFTGNLLNVSSKGNLLILGATFLWGLDNNITGAIADRLIVAKIVQLKAVIAGVGLLLIATLTHSLTFTNWTVLVYVVALGLFVFSGSAFLSIQSLKRLGAIRTTVVFPVSSVFGLVFASLLLHEQISIYQISAVGIIILGICLLTKRDSVVRENFQDQQ